MITYVFPGFTVVFHPSDGSTITHYPDGSLSGCAIVPEDTFHGDRLGIPPEYHRLAHELAHHLIGIYVLDKPSSFVVREDAKSVARTGHGLDRDSVDGDTLIALENEEWLTTGLTYYALGQFDILKEQDPPWDESVLLTIATKTDLDHLAGILEWLLAAPLGSKLDLTNAEW